MSDIKDQNHIFPEPEIDPRKNKYRPMLADDNSMLEMDKLPYQKIKSHTENNEYMKNVIKDISNTNIEALVRIKKEDEYEHEHHGQRIPDRVIDQSSKVIEKASVPLTDTNETKNTIVFEKKEKFSNTALGKFLKRFWWLVSLFVICSMAAVYFGVTYFLNNSVKVPVANKLEFRIDGPDSTPKGSLKTWNLILENKNSVAIKDIAMDIKYDLEFKPSKIYGDSEKINNNDTQVFISKLEVGQKKIVNIDGKLNSEVDINSKMSAIVKYYVDGIENTKQSPQYQNSNEKLTRVEKSLIRLDISSDARVPVESEQEIKIDFTNQSGKTLSNLRLKMTYPEVGTNFVYLSSDFLLPGKSKQTQPSVGDHTWNIISLDNGQSGNVTIRARVKGKPQDQLTLKAELIQNDDNQILNKTQKDIIIVDQPVSIRPMIVTDEYIKPEQTYTYRVAVKNNYNSDLRNVKVIANFVDNAELIEKEGFQADTFSPLLDKNKKELVYSGAGLPQLQLLGPKAEVIIEFTFKTKALSSFTNSSYSQDNFFIQPKVNVTGENFAPQVETGEIKRAKGGPIIKQSFELIKDGNKQMVRVTWDIKNSFSNLKDVTVRTRTALSNNSAWNQTSVTPPSQSTKISYNKDSGEIIWKAGDVKAYTGNNGQEVKVTFTITNDTDSKFNFVDTPTYTAIDTLNEGYEFNQLNNPMIEGSAISFQN